MAIDTKDMETIFDNFLDKTTQKITTLYNDTNMEDEHFATIAGTVISTSMNSSVNAYESIKRCQLIDKQIITEEKKALDISSSTAVRDAQSAKDLDVKSQDIALKAEQIAMSVKQQDTETAKALDISSSTAVRYSQSSKDLDIKYQQELSEKIKNGNVSITHTYDEETGEVLTTTYGTGTSKSVYEAQIEKIISEKILVNSQTTELARSVKFNNQIKALDSYADMIGTMGAGGLVVSVSMWKTLKSMIKSLNDGTTTVTYPADDDEFTIVKL